MKNRLGIYDIELFNQIVDAKDYPNIIGSWNNKLDSLWGRNYKDIIKIKTSMVIKGLHPNSYGDERHLTNVDFDKTPQQAEDIIKELQKILKGRRKNKK